MHKTLAHIITMCATVSCTIILNYCTRYSHLDLRIHVIVKWNHQASAAPRRPLSEITKPRLPLRRLPLRRRPPARRLRDGNTAEGGQRSLREHQWQTNLDVLDACCAVVVCRNRTAIKLPGQTIKTLLGALGHHCRAAKQASSSQPWKK